MLEVAGAVFLVVLTLLIRWFTRPVIKHPPGPLGLPFIGLSLAYLRVHRSDTSEQWVRRLVAKYGPIFKLHLLGVPTVFFSGPAANKFIYANSDKLLLPQQPPSVQLLLGTRNILMLHGDDHRRVRDAVLRSLKSDALRNNLEKVAPQVKDHFVRNWSGKDSVLALPLFRSLTLHIMCSLILGDDVPQDRDEIKELLEEVVEGTLAIPIKLPFSRFGRAFSASQKARSVLARVVEHKRAKSTDNGAQPRDTVTSLILLKNGEDDEKPFLTTEELVDNVITLLIAGYDSTSGLWTVLLKSLAENPSVYSRVEQEQEEIARELEGGLLRWEDAAKMKYTWKVVMECLRVKPPFFGTFRTVAKDFEYEGFAIKAGWQIVWTPCMTHMDEELFPKPLEFEPDRFEGGQPPFSYIPFGRGNRSCPGYEFARLQTLFVLHYLVANFKWSLCNPSIPISRLIVPTVEDGLQISLQKKPFSTL